MNNQNYQLSPYKCALAASFLIMLVSGCSELYDSQRYYYKSWYHFYTGVCQEATTYPVFVLGQVSLVTGMIIGAILFNNF